MNHAVTVGEVLGVVAVVGGVIGLFVLLFYLLDMFNPFRSGH